MKSIREKQAEERAAAERAERERREQADYKRMYEQTRKENQRLLERLEGAEAVLDEAKRVQADTQSLVASLRAHFDESMAYNQEAMKGLQTMFSTYIEIRDSFLNQPTQTAKSDGNVGEMVKLLTLLANDDQKK